MATILSRKSQGTGGGGGGGAPSGPAGGSLAGTYPNPSIAAGAVDTAELANDAVDSTKIAANAVDTAEINNGAVTAAKVAADVATQAELDAVVAAAAPSTGTYVTTAAEAGLSAEKVLGTTVIASGLLSARPAAAVAGYLYLATDVNGGTLYRDTGAAWVETGPGARYGSFNGQAGPVFPNALPPWTIGTVTYVANRVYLSRFVLPIDFTVTSIVFRSIGAGTNNVDVGIYNTSSVRLRSSGSTSGKKGAATWQTVNLSSPLPCTAGTVYYAALESDTADGTFMGTVYANQTEQMFGSTIGLASSLFRDTTFPLPDPIGALTANGSVGFVFALV